MHEDKKSRQKIDTPDRVSLKEMFYMRISKYI